MFPLIPDDIFMTIAVFLVHVKDIRYICCNMVISRLKNMFYKELQ